MGEVRGRRELVGVGNCLAALAIALGSARPAVAQSEENAAPRRNHVELTAFVGAFTPLSDLATDAATTSAEISTDVAVGGAIAYWLPSGLGFELQGQFVPAELTVQQVPGGGGRPTTTDLGNADYIAGTINLIFRPNLRGPLQVLLPFVEVGAGVRRLNVDAQASSITNDATDAIGTVAGGTFTRLSDRLSLRFEVRDYISSFATDNFTDSKLQNDVTVSFGLTAALR